MVIVNEKERESKDSRSVLEEKSFPSDSPSRIADDTSSDTTTVTVVSSDIPLVSKDAPTVLVRRVHIDTPQLKAGSLPCLSVFDVLKSNRPRLKHERILLDNRRGCPVLLWYHDSRRRCYPYRPRRRQMGTNRYWLCTCAPYNKGRQKKRHK